MTRFSDADDLADYVAQYEDSVFGIEAGELEWVHIPDLPVALLGGKTAWRRWWNEQNREARRFGCDGQWDHLLEEDIRDPIVIGFYGTQSDNNSRKAGNAFLSSIWDGNHRTAACILTNRPTIPAVVGVHRQCDLNDLPKHVARAVEAARMTAGKGQTP